MKDSLPEGYLSDQQNWMVAEYLYDRLQQQNPAVKEVNLLSLCSGDGRSEAYIAAHMKHKGIAVNKLVAVDIAYSNNAKPAFLQTLHEKELVQQGEWFSSAGDCLAWSAKSRFMPDAIISIHWAAYFSGAGYAKDLAFSHWRALEMFNLCDRAAYSAPFVRFLSESQSSDAPHCLTISDRSVFIFRQTELRDAIMRIQRRLGNSGSDVLENESGTMSDIVTA